MLASDWSEFNWADLLLEIAPVLLVDQDEVQVVAHAELLVDITHRRGKVVPTLRS